MSSAQSTLTEAMPASSQCPVVVPAHLLALRPAKIRDHHLARKAIVYVRQSTRTKHTPHRRLRAAGWSKMLKT